MMRLCWQALVWWLVLLGGVAACKKPAKSGTPPPAKGPLPVRMEDFTTEFERIPPNPAYVRKHRIREVVAVIRATKHGLREKKRERWVFDDEGHRIAYVELYDGKPQRSTRSDYKQGRLLREVFVDHGWNQTHVTQVAHDAAGRVTRKTSGDLTVAFHYDAAGRLLRKERRKGGETMAMRYSYVGSSSRIATLRLTRGKDRLVLEEKRGYDKHGREVSRRIRKPGMKLAPVTLRTTYDAQGRIGRIDVREGGQKLLQRRFVYAKGRLVKELVTSSVPAVGDDTIEYSETRHVGQ